MSIYEFKQEDAERFAIDRGIQTRKFGNELRFMYCPLCHGGAKRDRNTFSISLKTGQCECKRSGCSYKGNMITLSRDFNFEISEDVQRYFNVNNYNNRFRKFHCEHIESKDAAIEYMKSRGISEETTRRYEITIKKDTDNVLVFPFKNPDDELKFIKYRNITFKKGDKGSKEWCENDCMPILFGMNHCDPEDGPLIITEGQIDSLSVAECGFVNVVSVPTGKNGFTWIPHCWDWLQSFKELVIFGDNEQDGITLTELSKRFHGVTRIVRMADYRGCKDANEILQQYGKEAVIDAINNAEIVKDEHVNGLENVKAVDLSKLEAISTGIKEIDSILSGGFHAGELILLTGKRGDGKSTFMSQMIASARRQNYVTFAYSGELMDWYFKNWIDRQVAGKRTLTRSEIDAINKYYTGYVYIYDNSISNDKSETEVLMETIEKSIKQYGCRFICIDNLMTAIEADSNEKLYREQSNFVGRLARMAKDYNVVIMLVAHPRKSNGYQFQNDDVAGSSDITNKVDVVMSYDRAKDEEGNLIDDIRELKVTKNRLTGHLTGRNCQILLYYDDDSKRIVGADKNFFEDYGWFTDVTMYDEDVPFLQEENNES